MRRIGKLFKVSTHRDMSLARPGLVSTLDPTRCLLPLPVFRIILIRISRHLGSHHVMVEAMIFDGASARRSEATVDLCGMDRRDGEESSEYGRRDSDLILGGTAVALVFPLSLVGLKVLHTSGDWRILSDDYLFQSINIVTIVIGRFDGSLGTYSVM